MLNVDNQLLNQLKSKKKLTPTERAQLKALERKAKQQQKQEQKERKPKGNVFATIPTTKITPLPIRFTSGERVGLTTLADDIKSESMELVINTLGSAREINDTKLVRAAVYLLQMHSHEEIVDAIKQVKLNMIR
ncbi:hypothetical protein [Photobacterium sanguinicancri]|uniref:Uncharacterized protein n=1 Tax=Photobacterium sanguinicancri TaxID=875932 RepID=A0ABX4FTP7_9GAMM|nr:hypothetical protein [Photobacterium sanguinicancri]OZS42184.1 hypothetical protein ASV53_19825 [Photobacterium sanguinicancri]